MSAVLVGGGGGYIGSHVALAFVGIGQKTVVLDNLCTGWRDLSPPEAVFVEGDVANGALLDDIVKTHNITAVVNIAGSAIVPESVADPCKYYRNNTCASLSLIDACLRNNIKRFVFSSTSAVYGAAADFFEETAPCFPTSPYGMSKLMTEHQLADIGKAHDFSWCALRYFNVCGADARLRAGDCKKNATTLVKVAMEAAIGHRDKVKIFGNDYHTPDGTAVRDYVHVSDTAQAHLAALDYLNHGGDSGAFNIGIGKGFSVKEVLATAKTVSGVDFATENAPRRLGDPPFTVCNPAKAQRLLGFSPRYFSLVAMLESSWAWEMRQANFAN